jgi:hypothetical protein
MIKEFFGFNRKLSSQSCADFWDRVKRFVVRKRKSLISEINDETWQAEFLKEVKMGKLVAPGPVKNSKI